jgi:hypothetical protein
MPDQNQRINNTVIVTEDIFMKAAIEYCRRIGVDPHESNNNWGTRAGDARDKLAYLAEQILALKTVGAI